MKAQQLTTKTVEPFNGSQESLLLEPVSHFEKRIRPTEQSLLARNVTRRRFFKTVGLLTGSAVACNTLLWPTDAEAFWGFLVKEATKALAKAVITAAMGYAADRAVQYLAKKIDEARMEDSFPCRTFHDQFSDQKRFPFNEPPIETRFGYFFGIQDYAQTALGTPIASQYELNVPEIHTIIDPRNPVNHAADGSFFVPYPHEERRGPNSRDRRVFYRTPVIYERYRVDPRMFQLKYVRCFSNGRDLLTGYGVRAIHPPYHWYFLLVGGRA